MPTANSGPHTPWPDREGNIYFTEARAGRIGRLDPRTGQMVDQIVRFDPRARESVVFKTPTPNAQVRFLTVAPDGSIWYANFGNSRIGRIGR